MKKLNLLVNPHSKAKSEQFNAVSRKVDEIIDAINSGSIGGSTEKPDDALSAMLTNEMDSVRTDSDGIVKEQSVVTTKMIVYYGTLNYQILDLFTNEPTFAVCNARTGEVTVTIPKGYNITNGLNISITATTAKDTGKIDSITKTFSIKANKESNSVTNVGEWYDGLYVPYMGMVKCDGVTYQCINKNGSYKRPYIIDWSLEFYLKDSDDYIIEDAEGNILVVGEDGEDEYVVIAESALQLSLTETSISVAAKKTTSMANFKALEDTVITVGVIGYNGFSEIDVDVSNQHVPDGCSFEGTKDVVINIPKDTLLSSLIPIYTCVLTCNINGVKTSRECKLKVTPDYAYSHLYEEIGDKIGRGELEGGVLTIGGVTIGGGKIIAGEVMVGTESGDHIQIAPGQITKCDNGQCKPLTGGTTDAGGIQQSDMRLKEVENYIELSVEKIADAPIFNYRIKDSDPVKTGTSAQYWQGILPNVVIKGDDGFLMMEYAQASMAAVVSLARKVRELEQEIQILKTR